MPDVIVHSRAWKAQIPFLARFFRVVVSDPRGNGLQRHGHDAGRLHRPNAHRRPMGGAGCRRRRAAPCSSGVCTGAGHALIMAAERPERVLGVCRDQPGLRLTTPLPHRIEFDFDEPRESYEGWQKQNRHYWRQDWPDFSRLLLRRDVPRAALDEAARGLRRVVDGGRTPRRCCSSMLAAAIRQRAHRDVDARSAGRCGARCS